MINRLTDKNKITKYDIRTPMAAKKAFTIVELLVVIVVIAILAVITVVVYRGVTDSARNSVIVANLDQANKSLNVYKETSSNNGYPNSLSDAHITLNNDTNTAYNYYVSSDNTNYCLQATVNSKVQSIAGNNQVISNSSCVMATNLITNGDFSQGTNGWAPGNTSIAVSNNTLSITSTNSKWPGVYGNEDNRPTIIPGHIFYLRATVNTSDPGNAYFALDSNHLLQTIKTLPANIDTVFSGEAAITETNLLPEFYQTSGFSLTTTIKFKYIIVLDLTAAFGFGNEPTVAQMDTILAKFPNSWFNSSNVVQNPISQ